MPADPPERCPCQSDADDPGPHIASCPWSDLEYGTEAFEADMAEADAAFALGNAVAAALGIGWTLAEFCEAAGQVWPDIVETYGGHIARSALAAASSNAPERREEE